MAVLGFFLHAQIAGAAPHQALKSGHVPAGLDRLVSIARLPAEQRMKVAIGLPLRNEAALDELLSRITNPASPNYRQWLTPEEFAEKFGASREDYAGVIEFAKSNHLVVTATHPNRLVLDVEGAVTDIENAFHVTISVYQHPDEPRSFHAPDIEPSVDLTVPILEVEGLSDYSLPKPRHRQKALSAAQATANGGSGPSGTYRGSDFRAAYVPGTVLTGAGQSVGLLQFDGYYPADITTYETQAGLPNVTLVNVAVDGGVATPGSGNSEVCLDIEMALSMAPGLSKIYVYEAPNPSPWVDLLSRMANDNLAKQLSCSWGGGGPLATAEQIFKQMAAQGQTFFNASGDSDAFTSSVPFPADSTNITQVGGTTLTTTGPGGAYVSETVWNWGLVSGSYTGSSGGVSTYYGIPSYQLGISMGANQGSTTKRNIPDVALTADNIYVVYNNGSAANFGGTSCAAPLWAGLTALINQQAAANGAPSPGFLNPALYSLGKGSSYSSDFHDVTTGNNFSSSSPSKFAAAAGYDLCTGWGTPVGNSLIIELAGVPAPLIVSNSLVITAETCANGVVDPGETVTLNLSLKNAGGASTTNLVATLQSGGGVSSPSGPQNYGSLPAGGGAGTRAFSFIAGGGCGTTLTATLLLQDGSASLGSIPFSVPLGQLVLSTNVVQNFDGVSAPGLPAGWNSAVVSGAQTDWVTSGSAVDTAPNAAFASDSASAGVNALVSPAIPIATANAQLTFRHNYNLEKHARGNNTTYYDGGVLEIQIGAGAFDDILAVGGSFIFGGYNCTLASGTGNAQGGRQAWGGSSSGWTTTTVRLPSAAAGQIIHLRWACSTDSGNTFAAVGWYLDTISLQDGFFTCCVPSADLAVSEAAAPSPGIAGQTLNYTLTVANQGAAAATSVTLSDVLPANVTFISSSAGMINAGSNITASVGTLGGGATTNFSVTVMPLAGGQFTNIVSVTSGSPDSNPGNNSATSVVTVYVPPGISGQPTAQTVVSGTPASFSVVATGSAPLRYQWVFGAADLIGETNSALLLTHAQPSQAGPYSVIVTNVAGAVTSAVATLSVLTPPMVTAQPSNETVVAGSTATFNAAADGSPPLGYQWIFNGTTVVGTSSPTLSISDVQPAAAGVYALVVTNAAGSVTSSPAILTVLVGPSITSQPLDKTVVAGSNADFTVAAAGSAPMRYRWYFNETNAVGVDAPTLSLANVQLANGGGYSVVVSNEAGMASSSVATLTVVTAPVIIVQPTNEAVWEGATATFVLNASGSNPLAYQWYFNSSNHLAETGPILTVTNVQRADTGSYLVIVTNIAGSVTSVVANLGILDLPVLLAPRSESNDSFSFILSAPAGYNYIVEATTNLTDWEAAGYLSNLSQPTVYVGTNASGYNFRAFRARLLP